MEIYVGLQQVAVERRRRTPGSAWASAGAGFDRTGEQPPHGTSAKTVPTDEGGVRIAVPGDRNGTFEPLLI
jgi:transposase-like protein